MDDQLRELVENGAFANLTTLSRTGEPEAQVVWIDRKGSELLVNSVVTRRKVRNVKADPRVALTIWRPPDPYRFVEVRGHVVKTCEGEEALEHIDRLSHRYLGRPHVTAQPQERVILHIAIQRAIWPASETMAAARPPVGYQ